VRGALPIAVAKRRTREALAELDEVRLEEIAKASDLDVAVGPELGPRGRCAEACCRHRIDGAGAKAAFLTAATQKGAHRNAPAKEERSDSLGPAHFVGGHGDGVCPLPRRGRKPPGGLNGIDVQLRARFLHEVSDVGDGLDDARLVIDGLHRDEAWRRVAGTPFGERACDAFWLDSPRGGDVEPHGANAARFERLDHGDDGRVLEAAGDARPRAYGAVRAEERTPEGEVVGLGAARREHDVARAKAHELAERLARLFDDGLGGAPRLVKTRWVAPTDPRGLVHGGEDVWMRRSSGVPVQVDPGHAASLFSRPSVAR
jgi:hypothetical protein